MSENLFRAPLGHTHLSRHVTPAKLAHTSTLRQYFHALRRAKRNGSPSLIAAAVRRVSSWKPVMSVEQLIRQAPGIVENGQRSFYLFRDGARHFFTTDRKYGEDYLTGDWTVTRYFFFYSEYTIRGEIQVVNGIDAALNDIGYDGNTRSIDSVEGLCDYINNIGFGTPVPAHRIRDIGMALLRNEEAQDKLIEYAARLDRSL